MGRGESRAGIVSCYGSGQRANPSTDQLSMRPQLRVRAPRDFGHTATLH
jgi:hypothetical protein